MVISAGQYIEYSRKINLKYFCWWYKIEKHHESLTAPKPLNGNVEIDFFDIWPDWPTLLDVILERSQKVLPINHVQTPHNKMMLWSRCVWNLKHYDTVF